MLEVVIGVILGYICGVLLSQVVIYLYEKHEDNRSKKELQYAIEDCREMLKGMKE